MRRDIEIVYHDKKSLSRISKNSKQDQGVALDIILEHFGDMDSFIADSSSYRILALDGITNPQNLGMIIRSAAAGNIDAIMIQEKNSAKISPLVIKASAGTLFKMTIIKTQNLQNTLINYKQNGAELFSLSPNANSIFNEQKLTNKTIFILGNENEGVSKEIESLANKKIKIPMNNGVESLNVAITAALLSFCN
jgi:23S rRNA (guanosine2251-2'-O)-methyltransferase